MKDVKEWGLLIRKYRKKKTWLRRMLGNYFSWPKGKSSRLGNVYREQDRRWDKQKTKS